MTFAIPIGFSLILAEPLVFASSAASETDEFQVLSEYDCPDYGESYLYTIPENSHIAQLIVDSHRLSPLPEYTSFNQAFFSGKMHMPVTGSTVYFEKLIILNLRI